MEHTQIELDFGTDEVTASEALIVSTSNVVVLSQYASARQAVKGNQARSSLVNSIVESVDDIWEDLDAM